MTTDPSRAVAAGSIAQWDHETDVAVIGFGAAGACAALEAARGGATVTLYEASSGSGGASAMSGGEIYLGGSGGTPAQRDAGFTDATEDLEAYLMMAGGPDADAAKVGLYARESLAHYEWLVAQGVPYKGTYVPGKVIEPETDDTLIYSGSEEAWPFSEKAKPAPRGHVIQYMGWGGGRLLVDTLEARAREAGVDVHIDARARALVRDEDGTVVGLIVREDGREKAVRARRGVVLATGGFCMNREMVRLHAPTALRCDSPIGTIDDGVGILMGQSVGARTIHMDQFFTTCPWYPPESLVKGIFVNAAGQRFINEDCYHGRVSRTIVDQPGKKVWLLVDNAIFARPMELARVDLTAVGETWEEVEAELGFVPGTLATSVAQYNAHAAGGVDPMWHKAPKWLKPLDEPPFAALEFDLDSSYFSFFTLGGLETLPTGEVLDMRGEAIPGLYAAGRVTCGLPRWGAGYSSGMSLADCTFFGRMAGKSVAARGADTALAAE
ncbi:FAD-dependent oxidoreductase [Flavisphingomonas formosensis]|uniref:FAD-dependent oxidoreductase n=1 Tax=Flavisphingomonas formosensis TaxID=861534 RepID=UPI0012F81E19|nr:FAD-dependent oxidoreductase [Sphingomonas formosensis]